MSYKNTEFVLLHDDLALIDKQNFYIYNGSAVTQYTAQDSGYFPLPRLTAVQIAGKKLILHQKQNNPKRYFYIENGVMNETFPNLHFVPSKYLVQGEDYFMTICSDGSNQQSICYAEVAPDTNSFTLNAALPLSFNLDIDQATSNLNGTIFEDGSAQDFDVLNNNYFRSHDKIYFQFDSQFYSSSKNSPSPTLVPVFNSFTIVSMCSDENLLYFVANDINTVGNYVFYTYDGSQGLAKGASFHSLQVNKMQCHVDLFTCSRFWL